MTRHAPNSNHPRSASRGHLAVGLVLLALLLPRPALAQILRPWSPPGADSMEVWAAEARVRFQANAGDSVGGSNFRSYELVGMISRRMLRALGREHLAQAGAIQTVLDSLGLSAEVRTDAATREFVLIMVHNPFRPAAASVGFLCWFRAAELRTQGIGFEGGWRPDFRVWWSGRAETPYECGIVDHFRSRQGKLGLLLLRLNHDGTYWSVQQFGDEGLQMTGDGEAAWVDVNQDGIPELVTWARAPSDSVFLECSNCPVLYDERTYVVRPQGFELHDSRLMPSPYASFQLFVRLLHDQNRAAAARLLADPSRLDEAIALGWGASRRPGTWELEYGESSPWPRWLMLRFLGGKDRPRYVVHFKMRDGRWIISDWGQPRRSGIPDGTSPGVGGADSTRTPPRSTSPGSGSR